MTKFEVLREIGRGGAGIVYAAVERESGRRVALKTLRSMDGELLLQLKSEFRALQDLEHPNLIRLEHLMREGDTWFFTMELVNGVSFAHYVRSASSEESTERSLGGTPRRPRPDEGTQAAFVESRLREALVQLVAGLSALHATGKVHRDIKPANVLVTLEGRVVVLDLGLVREITAASEEVLTGTALYMAPEQVSGESVDPACDWYAVGVILYLCLTGRHPFEGSVHEVLARKMTDDPPAPSTFVREIPEDLDTLCMALLRREPHLRPNGPEITRRLERAAPVRRSSRPAPPRGQKPFVGRGAQLQALSAAFVDVHAGATVTVVVEGESGVGKSALVRRFARTLPSFYPDALVLEGRCHEREDVPYKALDGVIDALSVFLAALPAEGARALLPGGAADVLRKVFPVLQRVELGTDPHGSAPELGILDGRVRLFAALRGLLTRLARERPVVIVIDDMQWADDDSLALLASVLRPPAPPPLLLLTTARTIREEGFGIPGDVRMVLVDRLSHDEGIELATALLGSTSAVDPRAAASIAAEAEGHPFFLAELARHASLDRNREVARVTLDGVFAARVDGLEQGPRRLLEILAVAGIGLRQSAAMLASGTSVREYGAFAQALRARHLARTAARGGEEVIETYHDRVREAVVAHLGEDVRRRDHEAIARALEAATEQDPDALAAQWLAAGDPQRALAFILAAAEKGYQSLAFDRAAQLHERALALMTGRDARRAGVRLRLAESFSNAGRGAEAARVFGEAAREAPEREALDLRRRQAEHLLNAGRFEEGEAVMDQVLAAVGLRMPKSAVSAILLFIVYRLWLWMRGLTTVERPEAEIPKHELTRLDACASVAALLGMFGALRAIGLQTRGLLFALDAGEPVRLSRALAVDGAFLSASGRRAAPKWAVPLARANEIATRIGAPHSRGVVLGSEALIHHLVGDWIPALDETVKAIALMAQDSMGSVWDVRTAQMVLLWSLTWTGRLGDLRRELDSFLQSADARGDLYASTSMAAGPAGALAWLCSDDPAFARATVRRAAGRWNHQQYSNQHYWSFFAEAQADLYEGKGHDVWEGLVEHWPRMKRALTLEVQIIRIEALFFRARTAMVTAVERPALAAEMLGAAARDAHRLEREDAPYSRSMADLLLASIDAIEGRTPEAIVRLRASQDTFEARGMRLYRESARWRLGQLVGGSEGADLTRAAEAWATGEGVKNPGRMLALMAPGFRRSP